MIGPFVLMPMCDCTVNEKTKKKDCKPFLRAFVLDCNGLSVKGDYDYDAKPYNPTGEVSSEAKCCDCADCGCGKKKSKVCYDIHCLLRREELNGGLTNLQIAGPDGVLGPIVVFDPPVTDIQKVWERLNTIKYLGFDTWLSSGPGYLCVEIEEESTPPGKLTACRFRRFTLAGAQNNWLPIGWYGTGNSVGFATCADNFAVLDPNSTTANIQSTNIHYLCNVKYSDNGAPNTAAPGNLTNTRLYRTTFNSQSAHHYVHQSATGVVDVLNGTNIATGFPASIAAFPAWLESTFQMASIPSNVAVVQTSAPTTQNNASTVRFNVDIDVPCRVVLSSINNVIATSTSVSNQEVTSAGGLIGLGTASSHQYNFVQVPGVGTFEATPSLDGKGGSTNTDKDCNEVYPTDNPTGREAEDHIA